jgi:hypothetical protein
VAMAWVESNGLTSEIDYPYKAAKGFCKSNTGPYKINGYNEGAGCPTLVSRI